MTAIGYVLIALLTASTMAVDLRYAGGLSVIFDTHTEGMPRVTELIAILTSCYLLSVQYFNRRRPALTQSVFRRRTLILLNIIILMVMGFFTLFKSSYVPFFRTAVLIPSMIFVSIACYAPADKPQEFHQSAKNILLLFCYAVLTISSLIVILSAVFDLGGIMIDLYTDNAVRYCGWGQDVSYQSCYSLFGVCFAIHFLRHGAKNTLIFRGIHSTAFLCNVMAVLMTGAKTGYFILTILILWNIKYILPQIIFAAIIILISVFVFKNTLWNQTDALLHARINNLDWSGRDQVWSNDLILTAHSPLLGVFNYAKESEALNLRVIAHSQCSYFELIFWGGIGLLTMQIVFWQKAWNFIRRGHSLLRRSITMFFIVFLLFSATEILFYSAQCNFVFLIIIALAISCQSKQEYAEPALSSQL